VSCPALWLDDTRLQLPDEPDGAYFLRLVTTLAAAGYIDMVTGAWADPLYTHLGLDVLNNDEHWARVQRWITGQASDAELSSLVLPGQQAVQREFGSLTNQLNEVWEFYQQCREMQEDIERQQYEDEIAAWDHAADALRAADANELTQQLEAQLAEAYAQRHDRQALARLEEEYTSLSDTIDELFAHAALMDAWAYMDDNDAWDAEPQDAVDHLQRVQQRLLDADGERAQVLKGLRQALAAVTSDPQQDLLWDSLHTLSANWIRQLGEQLQRARSILQRYPDNPLRL